MSVQVNQYVMLAVKLPGTWIDEWEKNNKDKYFYSTFEGYMGDSAYSTKIGGKDGIFMLYDGMSGKYLYVGKVIAKTAEDDEGITMEIPLIDIREAHELEQQIKALIGPVDDPFPKYHIITHYR